MKERENPWFKFYPRDWLDDTRQLSVEERGAYIDAIAMRMVSDGPLPEDFKWLGHQLHVSARKAQTLFEGLVDALVLYRAEGGGFSQKRCEEEIEKRLHQRQVNVDNRFKRAQVAGAVDQRVNDDPTVNDHRVNGFSLETQPGFKKEAGADNSKSANEINESHDVSLGTSSPVREEEKSHTRGAIESEIEKKIDNAGAGPPPSPDGAAPDPAPSSEQPKAKRSRKRKAKVPREQIVEAFDAYNALAERIGLMVASKLDDERSRHIGNVIEDYGLDGWMRALANVERSKYLRGKNKDGWKADLDFLVRPSRFPKVHDGGWGNGAYHASNPSDESAQQKRLAEQRARLAQLDDEDDRPDGGSG